MSNPKSPDENAMDSIGQEKIMSSPFDALFRECW